MLRLVELLRFDHLGVFAYSREPGTSAARLPRQVSSTVAQRRREEIMLAQQSIVFARNRALRGTRMEVVIEEPAGKVLWRARSRTQAPDVDSVTYVKGKGLRTGEFRCVTVTGAKGYDLKAEA